MGALTRWAGRLRVLASNGSARWAFFTLLAAAAAWPYLRTDHLQLSDAVFLEATPPGQILRDIMLIDVPASKRDDPWNVWVGLWEMRRDGSRIPVTDAHGVSTQDGRVLAGSVRIWPQSDGGSP